MVALLSTLGSPHTYRGEMAVLQEVYASSVTCDNIVKLDKIVSIMTHLMERVESFPHKVYCVSFSDCQVIVILNQPTNSVYQCR